MELFQRILKTAIEGGASDVHLKIGTPVVFRINRELIAVESPHPTPEWMVKIVEAITPVPLLGGHDLENVTITGRGVLTTSFARVLGPSHTAAVSRVLAADPIAGCMVAARFEQVGMNEAALGGQFWGVAGGRDGLMFAGASMVPLAGDPAAMRSFAHIAGRRGRSVGPHLVVPG